MPVAGAVDYQQAHHPQAAMMGQAQVPTHDHLAGGAAYSDGWKHDLHQQQDHIAAAAAASVAPQQHFPTVGEFNSYS